MKKNTFLDVICDIASTMVETSLNTYSNEELAKLEDVERILRNHQKIKEADSIRAVRFNAYRK